MNPAGPLDTGMKGFDPYFVKLGAISRLLLFYNSALLPDAKAFIIGWGLL